MNMSVKWVKCTQCITCKWEWDCILCLWHFTFTVVVSLHNLGNTLRLETPNIVTIALSPTHRKTSFEIGKTNTSKWASEWSSLVYQPICIRYLNFNDFEYFIDLIYAMEQNPKYPPKISPMYSMNRNCLGDAFCILDYSINTRMEIIHKINKNHVLWNEQSMKMVAHDTNPIELIFFNRWLLN